MGEARRDTMLPRILVFQSKIPTNNAALEMKETLLKLHFHSAVLNLNLNNSKLPGSTVNCTRNHQR